MEIFEKREIFQTKKIGNSIKKSEIKILKI